MGFTGEGGLGKYEQGISHPIEAKANRGRLGIGASIITPTDDLPEKYRWTPEKEESLINLQENIDWLECDDFDETDITLEKLSSWINHPDFGDEKFCENEIFHTINKCKSSLDGLTSVQMKNGRAHSNPFEEIGKGIFQNRAAMKMANIDACFDFIFTGAEKNTDDILYFGDICAGPGGFSEYVLWKKKWRAHGFGMTLKNGKNDWRLDDFITGTETFEIYYGDANVEGKEGDIYVPENLTAFHQFIRSRVDQGVHFMMADGGFSVEGDENSQEVLSKRLYLCQFICALQNIRTGGHFMSKLFDCFTPFTVGLLYLIYLSFDRVCIFKPNTSRPANSERYFICIGKRQWSRVIRDHLFSLNQQLNDKKLTDIVSIVPIQVMKENSKFYKYICRCNNNLGYRQIIFLNKMKLFALDENQVNPHHGKFNQQCLERWRIPREASYRQNYRDQIRRLSDSPHEYFTQLMKPMTVDSLQTPTPVPLTFEKFDEMVDSLSLDYAVPSYKVRLLAVNDPTGCSTIRSIANERRGLILVMNRSKVFIKDTTVAKSPFEPLHLGTDQCYLNLPARTIVTGEIVYEYSDNSNRKNLTFHLIDCFYLAGEDVRRRSPGERAHLLSLFTKSIQNLHLESYGRSYADIRCRSLYDWTDIQPLIEQMRSVEARKSHKGDLVIYHRIAKDRNIIPTGLLIVPMINTNLYLTCRSKTSGCIYYFCRKTGQHFDKPPENIYQNVHEFSMKTGYFWPLQLDFNRGESVKLGEGKQICASIFQVLHRINEMLAKYQEARWHD